MRLIVLFLPLLLAVPAYAEQSHFAKLDDVERVRLEYKWADANGRERELTLDIDKNDIPERLTKPRGYMPDIAQRYVYIEMMKATQSIDPREVRVRVQQRGKEIVTDVKADQREVMEKWQRQMSQLQKQAMDKYLAEYYYSYYTSPSGEQGVKPDHVRYGNESLDLLRPLAQQLYQMVPEDSTTREYVNLVLSWVQSIPYDTLENRLTSNGSGYSPPINLIMGNHGDCDSKTVLAAALLRSLVPNLPLKLVFLSDHALLGATLPHRDFEDFAVIDGQDYLLMEPTGPAIMVVGKIADSSLQQINSGMFTSENF